MVQKDIIKIFFIALITGNIMGIILIQIFQPITISSIILLEIVLMIIIIFLFIVSKFWHKRLEKINK